MSIAPTSQIRTSGGIRSITAPAELWSDHTSSEDMPVGLTGRQNTSNLIAVSLAKPILPALLVVALAAYAFNCEAATNPEQAMQCCNSMPCSSSGHHGQDCCKTMPAMHAPFVQPSSVRGVFYSLHVSAVLTALGESPSLPSSVRVITTHCHAPPIVSVPAPLPLRI